MVTPASWRYWTPVCPSPCPLFILQQFPLRETIPDQLLATIVSDRKLLTRTAGVDQYLTLNDLFIRDSEGFILVFSSVSFQDHYTIGVNKQSEL